jgi:hypothetical protein
MSKFGFFFDILIMLQPCFEANEYGSNKAVSSLFPSVGTVFKKPLLLNSDMKSFLTLALLTLQLTVCAQMSLNDLNIDRIPQKKVREFVLNQQTTLRFDQFQQIQPTLTNSNEAVGFKTHRAKYQVKSNLTDVWGHYKKANPAESWEGKRFSFGFAFNKHKDQLVYRQDESNEGIEEGQMFYVNLKLLGGIYNMAVAFEIITVDPINKVLEFSYVEGGQSKGMQRIELSNNEKGQTDIIHTSFFKSDSKFRDAVLYPFFHKRIINEFHRRMRKRIK